MIKLSYTGLSTYESCPFKYKLRYVDKQYDNTQTVATEFGTLIHSIEEQIAHFIIKEEPIDYDSLIDQIEKEAEKLALKYPEAWNTPDKANNTYGEKVDLYITSYIYSLEKYMKLHPSYHIIGVEQPFSFPYNEDFTFSGYIDRVFYDTLTDHYYVQDIKTWSAPATKAELKAPLQFVIYALALNQVFSVDLEKITCQYYVPFCKVTQEVTTTNYIEIGRKNIDDLLTGIKMQSFNPHPTVLCHWCSFCKTNESANDEFKYLCPYFCHWTRENKTFKTEAEWFGMQAHPLILESYLQREGKTYLKGGEEDGKSSSI